MVVGWASFTTYAGHGFIDSWITKMATNNVNNKLLKEAHDFSQTLIGQGIEWSASWAISGAMVYNIWRGMQKLREWKLKWKSFFESGRHLMATLALSSVMLVWVDAPGLLAKDAIKPILNTTASTATANLSDALQAAKNQTEKGMVLLHKGATDYVKAVLDGEKFNNVWAWEWTAYVSLKALEQDPRTSLNDPRLSDANMRTAVTALSAW
jgi:hypothetical protein